LVAHSSGVPGQNRDGGGDSCVADGDSAVEKEIDVVRERKEV
jgi:hypothetical protein